MLRSYKWMGMGMGLGWVGYLCGVLIINTNDKPAGSGGKGVMQTTILNPREWPWRNHYNNVITENDIQT